MTEHTITEPVHSVVEHQFEDRFQQKEAATLGMWAFLATEVLFFGGLFVAYTVYRHQYPDPFRQGALNLKWYLGGINTAVLLLSSFTMALAVHSAAIGSNAKIARYLILTIIVGGAFLAIKATEYYIEYREHLIPGLNFAHDPPKEEEVGAFVGAFEKIQSGFDKVVPPRQKEETRSDNEELFFLFYFIMTAIHATHMIIGIGIMLVLIWMAKREMFSAQWHNPVENFGLYWHFVDIVWVFLFPTLYLLRQP